jgi:phosphoglucomutase
LQALVTRIDPLAGTPAGAAQLIDVPKLLAAYSDLRPDPGVSAQRVGFGTSGHRGSPFERSFNEWHVLAICQAVCEYRKQQGVDGPLFLGIDSHAVSAPAAQSALQVLAANDVTTLIAAHGEFTPTPAISHAILVYNRERRSGLADGIVITPSHNPPDNGGIKYNPPNGGPADTGATGQIEARANALLASNLGGVRRVTDAEARSAPSTHEHDFIGPYVADLQNVIDFEIIRGSSIRMGVDPLGGAGVHYWARIAERYRLNLSVISERVDPTFSFMTLDWDGRIRMDPSSVYAMQRLIAAKDSYEVAFACDTDHDRHGIVTRTAGLLPANHYLSVAIDYLFRNRPQWPASAAVGKTVVSTSMIDRVTARLGRRLFEVPVGFKWYVEGLRDGSLCFGGEESAGASFARLDGTVWTTDKDGIVPALLAAEITARTGHDPGQYYEGLTRALGAPLNARVEAPANASQRRRLAQLRPDELSQKQLAGESISLVLDRAPGNGAPIGGIKVVAPGGWFAARPSGTEDLYKIYAESDRDEAHLGSILREAQAIVDAALAKA